MFVRLVLLIAICGSFIGCQKETYELPNAVKIAGTLSNDGEILEVAGRMNGTGRIVIGFHPIVDGKPIEETTQAWVGEEGTFEISQGIEPGEYLLTVYQLQDEKDLLKGKFGVRKSKIIRTIDVDTFLDIDISKPEGE